MRRVRIDFRGEVIRTPVRNPGVDIRGGVLVKIDGVPVTLHEGHAYAGDYPFLQLQDMLREVPGLLAGESVGFVMFGERTILEVEPRDSTAELRFSVGPGYRGEEEVEVPEGGPYVVSLQEVVREIIRAGDDFLRMTRGVEMDREARPYLDEFDHLLYRARGAYEAYFGQTPPGQRKIL